MKKHKDNISKLERYEQFMREVKHKNTFYIDVTTISETDLRNFHDFLQTEHLYVQEYPGFYKPFCGKSRPRPRSENSISTVFCRLRTVINWCIAQGLTLNNPFYKFEMTQVLYADPFYLHLDERNKIYHFDFSQYPPQFAVYRDIFMLQCLIGCRVGDLQDMTNSNIINDGIEYIPRKTRNKRATTIRVPLNGKAKDIIDRYKDTCHTLVPVFTVMTYNKYIREILKIVGINRCVTILNPLTRLEEHKPLYEVASSHTARKTFIGNLYNRVKDPNLISSLTGHSEGSKAFARYRTIEEEAKRELVNMLD